MSKPLTDEIKLTIRDEFVHGFIDESGTRKFPSIDMLVSRHDVARATLYRAATKEDWQKQKNQYQHEKSSEPHCGIGPSCGVVCLGLCPAHGGHTTRARVDV